MCIRDRCRRIRCDVGTALIDNGDDAHGDRTLFNESRPNVTSDAAALALKSGNVCVLRGGKEAFRSARAIVTALKSGLVELGLPRCV